MINRRQARGFIHIISALCFLMHLAPSSVAAFHGRSVGVLSRKGSAEYSHLKYQTIPRGLTAMNLPLSLKAASEDATDAGESEKPSHTAGVNLVDQKTYISSIETLKREIAKANGLPEPEKDKDQPVYALGRFEVPLRIDSSPGLDLTDTYIEKDVATSDKPSEASVGSDGETTMGSENALISPGLTLVTGVQGNAADAGLQALDTIVGVSVKDVEGEGDEAVTKKVYFTTEINSASLETTAIALQTAMGKALELNKNEIYLEMNRLIAGYYN